MFETPFFVVLKGGLSLKKARFLDFFVLKGVFIPFFMIP